MIGAVALETDEAIGIPDDILTLDTPAGDYERTSMRMGLQLFPGQPFREDSFSFQPFVGGGAHYSSVDFLGQSPGAWGPYASAGFLQRLRSTTDPAPHTDSVWMTRRRSPYFSAR